MQKMVDSLSILPNYTEMTSSFYDFVKKIDIEEYNKK
jgi:hypothetical protein